MKGEKLTWFSKRLTLGHSDTTRDTSDFVLGKR